MAWVRSGYCCRCGECCVGVNAPASGEPKGPQKVPDACPLFEWGKNSEGGKMGVCTHYGKHPFYLTVCQPWPRKPSEIENCPSCTYKFDWVEDK